MAVNTNDDLIRMGSEVAMFIGAFLYLLAAVREAGFLGTQMFIENLVSWVLVIISIHTYLLALNTRCYMLYALVYFRLFARLIP